MKKSVTVIALQLIAAEVFNDRGREMFDTHSLTLIRRRNDSDYLPLEKVKS